MERPEYKLIVLFMVLGFVSPAGRIFARQTFPDKIENLSQNSTGTSESRFKQQIYLAYISGKMDTWKTAIDEMERQKNSQPAYIQDLINYQYGYVAWCLGKNNKDDARKYLSCLEKNLELLKSVAGETAEFHAYSAASYGFKIGLSTWRAPFFGPKSMDHAEKSLEKNSQSFQANMEMGNIWNHMPAMFGGSDEKALKYYLKALEIMETKPAEIQKNNWMHLNLLTLVGQMYQEMGNPELAKKYFEQALQIEPGFVWVKEELLPSLKTN